MLLSIIIPVYNAEKYIQKCLESITELPLSEDEYEIIVVNDGTQDNSIAIITKYKKGRNNFRIINQTNKGPGAARNTGIKHATGEWIYFIDSDDYIDAQLFTELFVPICYDSRIDIITGDFWDVKNSSLFKSKCTINTIQSICMLGSAFFANFYHKIDALVWRSIYRRSFIIDNSLFFIEGVYHEDVTWVPQCFATARMVYYSPIPFYNYVIREGSITQSAKNMKKLNDLMFVDKDLLTNSLKFDKEVQKVISYYVLRSLLALNGRYQIFKNQELYTEINSIMLIPAAHSTRFKIVYFIFRMCPCLVNSLLGVRYGKERQTLSF